MDKKTILFIVILGAVVLFFSSLIIIMDGLATKPSDIISVEENEVAGRLGSTGKRKYDFYKPKANQDKKIDLQYAPRLEDKFTGKEPIIDI